MKVLLKLGNLDFAKVEHAGSQGSIGMTQAESIGKVFLGAGATAGNDRDAQFIGKAGESFVREALLHAIVVHAGKENLTGTTVCHLASPVEERALHADTTAIHIAVPAISIAAGINSRHANLGTKVAGNLIHQLGVADSGRVQAHLVGTGFQQAGNIDQFMNTTAHGKGNGNGSRHTGNHIGKGLATFVRGGDIEEHEFICPLLAVGLAQLYRVACIAQVHEIDTFDGTSVLDIQTGNDTLGEHKGND